MCSLCHLTKLHMSVSVKTISSFVVLSARRGERERENPASGSHMPGH